MRVSISSRNLPGIGVVQEMELHDGSRLAADARRATAAATVPLATAGSGHLPSSP